MEKVSRIFLLFVALLAFSDVLYSHPGQAFYSSVKPVDVNVFEENGKVGLKDQQGHVLVPAQYEAMGWSNGDFSVVNNVTGYKSNGLWGLINLQNNRITKADYVDLSWGEGDLLVARKKITNSVKILTGCINTSGKEVIPFAYDGLRVSSFRAIVYTRTGSKFKHGLIDFENKLLIPIQYQHIYPLGSLRYGVENFENKTAIFSEDGVRMTDFLIDSLSSFKKDFAVIYQHQRQGLIDRQGQIRLEPSFREIKINDDGTVSARQSDVWLCLDGQNQLLRQTRADGISVVQSNLVKIEVAGKNQLADKEFKPVTEQFFAFVGPFNNGKATFLNQGKFGIIDEKGKVLVKPVYKKIIADRDLYRAQLFTDKQQWILLDATGNAVTYKGYDDLAEYNGRYFPARHRGYWGALNEKGKEIVACVHDSLIDQQNDLMVVKFKGQYGIINLKENWIVTPRANRLSLLNDSLYLEQTPTTLFLKSLKGQIIYFSDNKLEFKADYLLEYLSSGDVWKVDFHGRIIDRAFHPENVQEIFPEQEGLRAIKKDGRYGFVDDLGRLRIANRYEEVRSFSERLAPTKILGKWGFINHEDKIAVQPVYDEVASFRDGFALVKLKDAYGLIDRSGRLVLPTRYDSIIVQDGKRFRVCQNSLWGLFDKNGRMIINPKYDQLIDLDNGYVIVSRDGKFGLLNLEGISTIPQIYDGLQYDQYHDQYFALKRSEWEVTTFQ
jgi:hypothetical protein